jgi:hypothetical protein
MEPGRKFASRRKRGALMQPSKCKPAERRVQSRLSRRTSSFVCAEVLADEVWDVSFASIATKRCTDTDTIPQLRTRGAHAACIMGVPPQAPGGRPPRQQPRWFHGPGARRHTGGDTFVLQKNWHQTGPMHLGEMPGGEKRKGLYRATPKEQCRSGVPRRIS